MSDNIVQMIDAREVEDDCGRGHACSFCPEESTCQLNQEQHSRIHLEQRLARINWVVPVMANKGGVGKSTVAANLALALAQKGYAVGLADADVHGPSVARLLGLQEERVRIDRAGIATPEFEVEGRGNLRAGSLAYFLESADNPVVWRDAYKHDYIHHMLGSFNWGVLDYLIVDMPPGTGNELITLGDALKGCNTAALLVSSADAIALQDSLKAARYCQESELPLLGLVENYAGTICPHCGGEFEMFPRAPEADEYVELDPKLTTGDAVDRAVALRVREVNTVPGSATHIGTNRSRLGTREVYTWMASTGPADIPCVGVLSTSGTNSAQCFSPEEEPTVEAGVTTFDDGNLWGATLRSGDEDFRWLTVITSDGEVVLTDVVNGVGHLEWIGAAPVAYSAFNENAESIWNTAAG